MDFTDDKARVDEQLAKQCTATQLLKFEFKVLISTVHYSATELSNIATNSVNR